MLDNRDPGPEWPEPTEETAPELPDESGNPIATAPVRPLSRWQQHHAGLRLVGEILEKLATEAPCCAEGCAHCDALAEMIERLAELEAEARAECDRRADDQA